MTPEERKERRRVKQENPDASLAVLGQALIGDQYRRLTEKMQALRLTIERREETLRKKEVECEKLRIMLRTALETAWGPYFEEDLRRIANGRERDAEKTAGPRDGGGDRRE